MICGVLPPAYNDFKVRRTAWLRQFFPSLKSSGSSRTPALRFALLAVNPGLVMS